jgi:uncharacterized protein (DUF697 family)
MTQSSLAAPVFGTVADAIESIIAGVPPSREHAARSPELAARALARKAATKAAMLSGTLALPPGVFGMLTVLPDLIAIWRIQAQMVSDLAGLYGKDMELTRTHMLYCLFRHAASHLTRDFVVRAGQRFVIQELSAGALRSVLTGIGINVTQRIAGTAASRWLPVIGAAAVATYAYFDTLQVAKTAIRMLATPTLEVELSEDDSAGAQALPVPVRKGGKRQQRERV